MTTIDKPVEMTTVDQISVSDFFFKNSSHLTQLCITSIAISNRIDFSDSAVEFANPDWMSPHDRLRVKYGEHLIFFYFVFWQNCSISLIFVLK